MDVGQVVNQKYKLLRLVGDGGMGSVFEAEHLMLGTHVAIKVLHGEMARRSGLVDRFLQEARVSAQIKSPHVVQVTDVDRTPDGVAYLVMELLQGEPLSALLDRDKKAPEAVACEYTLQILHALEAAHALGVIHRDLKPENVFITYAAGKPVLKLIDFGIAKLRRTEVGAKNLTVAGVMMGTAEYMAPEQAFSADQVDARADIYSVGVMLYELIAGHRPVSGDDARVIALKVQRGEVKPLVHAAPGVTPEIAGLVHRAMAPSPDVRFSSAAEMRLALESATSKKQRAAGAGGGTVRLVGGDIPRAPAGDAPAGPQTAQVAAVAHAATAAAPNGAPKTGTMMGAPVELVMGNAAAPGMSTARAAPVDIPPDAYGAPPGPVGMSPAPPAYVAARSEPPRRPQKKGLPKWLLVLPALAGALVGVALVVWYVQEQGGGPRPVPPVATGTATAPTATATTTTADTSTPIPTTTPLSTNTGATPLPTTTTTTAPTTTTTATARPDGGVAPPIPTASASSGPTPFVFPSTFPPIPSTMPSSFPLPGMSGFPFPVPPPPQ